MRLTLSNMYSLISCVEPRVSHCMKACTGVTFLPSPATSLPTAMRVSPSPWRGMPCIITAAAAAAMSALLPFSGSEPACEGTPVNSMSILVVARKPFFTLKVVERPHETLLGVGLLN